MRLQISRKALEVSEPVSVALIATYPQMTQILGNLVEGSNIKFMNIHASFDDAVTHAKKIEHEVDVILTRGGTGHYIKESVSVPVVSVPITPFDLLLSVSALSPQVRRVAFVNYQRPIFGVESIERLCGKEIIQYQFQNKEDLLRVASEAKADGCDYFLGGAEGAANARSIGMEATEIVSGEEAIYQALVEVIEIVNASREERKRSARLHSAFDSLTEGICVTDERGKISVFNPAATRIFGLSGQSLIGRNIRETPIGALVNDTFDHTGRKLDHLEHIRDITVNTNYIPIHLDQRYIGTVRTFQDVSKIQRLEGQIRRQLSQKGFAAKYTFNDILTCDPQMQNTKRLASLYAKTDSAILIEGESGTGKELFAHSIHSASSRSVGPFVTVNCAAIPEQLLESELFGYAPGAFTGARREGKSGLFELAHNGTIFLDEIGEMPKYLQSRLLRVLQEKEIMRVGDDKIISVNCRVISATNKNLADLVSRDEFRKDLYYRLSIFTVKVPPLRERRKDILILSEKFFSNMGIQVRMDALREKIGRHLDGLQEYLWPGNVRELQSVCARLALIQNLDDLEDIRSCLRAVFEGQNMVGDSITLSIDGILPLKAMLEEAEQQYIAAVLKRNNNNQSLTALQLGIGRTTLWRKHSSNHSGEES